MTVDFEGSATELTSTHFEFSIDTHGSLGQVNILQAGNPTPEPAPIPADSADEAPDPAGRFVGGLDKPVRQDINERQLIGMMKFVYQQLRVWRRHADGSQQLLALGEKSIGALYLGHLTAPLQAKTAEAEFVSAAAPGGSADLPRNSRTDTAQQINFTA